MMFVSTEDFFESFFFFLRYLSTEEFGPKHRPLPGHSQVYSHTLGCTAPTQQRPLSGQSLSQLSVRKKSTK